MPSSKKHLFREDLQLTAVYGYVISHPVRIVILRRLAEQGVLSFQAILRALPLCRSTISNHLRVLERAQLIVFTELPGEIAAYRLQPMVIAEARELLSECLSVSEQRVGD